MTRKEKSELENSVFGHEFANNAVHHKTNAEKALEKAKNLEARQISDGKRWTTLDNGAKVLR